MKPQHAFTAQRTLACHCPELLGSGPAPRDHGPALSALGDNLARALAGELARLTGAGQPAVSNHGQRHAAAGEWAADAGQSLAAHTVLAIGEGRLPLVASIEGQGVLALFDRAFGGTGDVPQPLPDAFPLSAELFIARLADMAARAVSGAFGFDRPMSVTAHGPRLDRTMPFAADEPLHVLRLRVEEDGGPGWSLELAVPDAIAGDARGGNELSGKTTPTVPRAHVRRGAGDAPFAEMPLTITATLVDMAIPFTRLAALRCGDVLPVAVARSVPLSIGGSEVAFGTIGEFEDRIAVQITKAF